jgi:hypothetical protein
MFIDTQVTRAKRLPPAGDKSESGESIRTQSVTYEVPASPRHSWSDQNSVLRKYRLANKKMPKEEMKKYSWAKTE